MFKPTGLTLLLLVVSLVACATPCDHCARIETTDEVQLDTSSFESGCAELELAVRSTPQWQTQETSRDWVRGLAEIAIERADALHPHVVSGQISCGAIDLARMHVERLARIDHRLLSADNASLHRDAEEELSRAADERAWFLAYAALPAAERYVDDGLRYDWVHTEVATWMIPAMERAAATPAHSFPHWDHQIVPEECAAEVQARMQRVLDAFAAWESTALN